MSVRAARQQMLPSGFPRTPIFAYGPRGGHRDEFRTPAATIEVDSGAPTRITWHNELIDGHGRYVRPLLPIDPTLH